MIALSDVKGVGAATLRKLEELGVTTPAQLVLFLPSKYVDLHSPVRAADAECGQFNIFEGIVVGKTTPGKRGTRSFTVRLLDCRDAKGGGFKVTFFNQPYYHSSFKEGERYLFLGKTQEGEAALVNPVFEPADKVRNLDGVFTVYPLRGAVGQSTFKKLVRETLSALKADGSLPCEVSEALELAHFPHRAEDAERGISRLAAYDTMTAVAIYKRIAGRGDKFTFAISVFSLFFALIQIALSIATWVISAKIKRKYKNYKEKVSGVSYVISRYIAPNVRRRQTVKAVEGAGETIGTVGHTDGGESTGEVIPDSEQISEEQSGVAEHMDNKNKPKSTIAQKLAKIKSRFLRTLAALSLTDKEADEAMKASEEEENAKAENLDDTERFESDYMKNRQSTSDNSSRDSSDEQAASDVIVPDDKSVSISVDEEYVERYKRRKAEKRKESVDDVKKKLGDFGDKVDEAGNKFTENIKSAYKKVKSKIKPAKNKQSKQKQSEDASDEDGMAEENIKNAD